EVEGRDQRGDRDEPGHARQLSPGRPEVKAGSRSRRAPSPLKGCALILASAGRLAHSTPCTLPPDAVRAATRGGDHPAVAARRGDGGLPAERRWALVRELQGARSRQPLRRRLSGEAAARV